MEGTIGEIRMFAANFAPRNWAYCQGQLMSIATNSALFSILGTTYGGNGVQTFALPNLSSRIARGTGNGAGLSSVQLGEMAGTPTVTLTQATMPAHTHVGQLGTAASSNSINPAGNAFGPVSIRVTAPSGISASGFSYSSAANATGAVNGVTVGVAGTNSPMSVMNPYLAMNYVICMFGIYPSRN